MRAPAVYIELPGVSVGTSENGAPVVPDLFFVRLMSHFLRNDRSRVTHGTAIYADQLGWFFWGQCRHILQSHGSCLGVLCDMIRGGAFSCSKTGHAWLQQVLGCLGWATIRCLVQRSFWRSVPFFFTGSKKECFGQGCFAGSSGSTR